MLDGGVERVVCIELMQVAVVPAMGADHPVVPAVAEPRAAPYPPRMQRADEIPLSILVVDADEAAARALTEETARDQRVICIAVAHSIEEAQRELRSGDYNLSLIHISEPTRPY